MSYAEALGGDIVQISFEENPDDDPLNPTSCSLCLAINYEFPPSRINFEWCDGNDYEGGVEAIKYSISNSEFIVWLDTDVSIKVNFSTNTSSYKKIVSLLRKELGESVNA
ncbi:MAG: hypothetical protein WCP96_03430 [Methylococcaceae bacterium]